MNPLSLTLQGFKGIRAGLGRESLTLNFDMAGALIAIAGSNGAGKTTVLDNLHPYRLMPSRASSYSPAAFSYYDHTYGVAKKELRWEHCGQVFLSTLIIKGATKSKSQECYLLQDDGAGGWKPVELPDRTISDGKSATYDACVEHVLGTPEMFFTSVFSCQGRRTLADYTNGDIKALMSELLGLDSILALGIKAGEVGRIAKAKLEALRERVRRASDVDQAITEARYDVADKVDAAEEGKAGRARLSATLADQQRRLAEAQAGAAVQAANARRRETLTGTIAHLKERQALAVSETRAAGAQRARETQAEITAAGAEVERARAQLRAALERIDRAEALVGERPYAQAAALQQAEVDVKLAEARAARAAAEEAAQKKREAEAQVSTIEAQLSVIQTEGHGLRKSCESLALRAGLADEVPCKGTDLQGRCTLLAEALSAKGTLATEKPRLEAKRAERETVTAELDAARAALKALPEPDLTAGKRVDELEAQSRALAARAAQLPAIEAAATQLALDQAAKASLIDAEAAAAHRLKEANLRLATNETVTAEAIERDVRSYAAQIDLHQVELDALPPENSAALAAAEAAVAETESILAQQDAAIAAMQGEIAALNERIAMLGSERESLNADVARATAMENEVACWALLQKALGQDGIVALCIDDAGPTLTSIANDLLAACYGSRFSVAIRTQAETKAGTMKETFDLIVYDAERGDEKSIRDVSGGERVWINEAVIRAIALYHSQASGRTFGALFSDESDGALDSEKKRQYAAMMRRVLEIGGYARQFFISHSPEVREAADAVVWMDDYKVAGFQAAA